MQREITFRIGDQVDRGEQLSVEKARGTSRAELKRYFVLNLVRQRLYSSRAEEILVVPPVICANIAHHYPCLKISD